MAEREPSGESTPERTPEFTLEQALGWSGIKVDDLGGSVAGRAEIPLLDAVDGSISWVVIRLGRFGRRTALPIELFAAGVDRLWVPLPRTTIRSAPEVHPDQGMTCGLERSLGRHLGLLETSGRLARIVGREDSEPGSVTPPTTS